MRYFAHISNPQELKSEYRRLVMENHPDKGGDPVKMRQIIETYESILENGIHISHEEITVDDVEDFFNEVADIMDYEEDDFVDMDFL